MYVTSPIRSWRVNTISDFIMGPEHLLHIFANLGEIFITIFELSRYDIHGKHTHKTRRYDKNRQIVYWLTIGATHT